jgi:antitoxin VapB
MAAARRCACPGIRPSGEEVYIKKIDGVVMLIPKGDPWKPFVDSLTKFSPDFMDFERDQGTFEDRDALE